MSVPEGTLTPEYRTKLLDFYGHFLRWREIESLRLDDRLTIAVGPVAYVNIRERPQPMQCSGYEHFGVSLPSAADLRQLARDLASDPRTEELEELSTNEAGEGSFRFRYLLPLAVEAQYYAALLSAPGS